MQFRVLVTVHAGSDTSGFGPEGSIVPVMREMDHLVLERILDIRGEMFMVPSGERDEPVAAFTCPRDTHARRPPHCCRGQAPAEEGVVQGVETALQLTLARESGSAAGKQVTLIHDALIDGTRPSHFPIIQVEQGLPARGAEASPAPEHVAKADNCRTR